MSETRLQGDRPAAGPTAAMVRAGLYGLKPWFADRLARLRRLLLRRRVHPTAISVAGVGFGAAAGLALGTLRPGPFCALAVAAALVARLACANLDGAVARESGRAGRFGAVVNELGDRAAELAALAGCAGLAATPGWLLASTALACSAPSWVALAGAAGGAPRIQGGPVGKTERCVLLVLIAATGRVVPLLSVLALGSAVTAAVRLARLRAGFRAAVPASPEGTAS